MHGWDLVNEPEWVTLGLGTWSTRRSVLARGDARVHPRCRRRAHRLARQPVTVGSASTRWLRLVNGLDLDFYQPHWYDSFEARVPALNARRGAGLRPARRAR